MMANQHWNLVREMHNSKIQKWLKKKKHVGGRSAERGMHACVLNCFPQVQLYATLWIVAHQAPLSGIFQARMLEWGEIGRAHV